jgi:ribosome-associated translation inhibitor RaiA
MVEYLTFQKGDRQIKITQADWRDDYFIYKIEVAGNKVFQIDIRNQDAFKAVDKALVKLKQQL